jgi:MFS family permease
MFARKMGLLGSLYFSQGLPFGFFTQALPVLLRNEGFSLGQIGLSSMLALPWALKFLWAPWVDRYSIARIGSRKSWILPLQLGSMSILLVLSLTSHSTTLLMAAVLPLNLFAATQDIATDGLAVDMLAPNERGFANGLQVAGYRFGMLVGGGILLIVHDQLGAGGTFSSMAAMTALATLPILLTHEPSREISILETRKKFSHFLRRSDASRLLLLIVAYKAGDAFATGMLRPYLTDSGLTLSDIGWLVGTVGFIAGLSGAMFGGVSMNRLTRKTALGVFGLLQAATVAGYAYISMGAPNIHALYALCAAEHFASGMATSALFTCMMDWCSRETSATDYTVQASAVVIATGIASTLAGFSAQYLGYFGHFSLSTTLAFGAVIAVWKLFPKTRAMDAKEVA